MKRLLAIILAVACIAMIVSCDDTCKHKVTTHHDEIPATCSATGTRAYYECANCHAKFEDEAATTPASDDSLVIAIDSSAHGTMTPHAKVDATCVQTGTKAYYQCALCGNKYEEEAGTTPITDLTIPVCATAHTGTLTHHDQVAATCAATGTKEYWECEDCHNKYSESAGTSSPLTTLTIPKDYTNHVGCTLSKTNVSPANCTSEGNIAYWTCSKSGKTYSDSTGKTIVTDTVVPRHVHLNSTTHICSDCGNYIVTSIDDFVAALEGEVSNIGFGADIDWDSYGVDSFDIPDGTVIDFCGCTISNIDNNILLRGDNYTLMRGTLAAADLGYYFIIGDDDTTIPGIDGEVAAGADLSAAQGTNITVDGMTFELLNVVVGIKNVNISTSTVNAANNALCFNGGSGSIENVTLSSTESTALRIAGPGSVMISGENNYFSAAMETVVGLSGGCNVEIVGGGIVSISVKAPETSAVNLSEAAGLEVNGTLDIACEEDNDYFAIGFCGEYSAPDGAHFIVGDSGTLQMNNLQGYKLFGTVSDNADGGHYVVFMDNAQVLFEGGEMAYYEDAEQWFGDPSFIKPQKSVDNPNPQSVIGQFYFYDYRANWQ